jgi:amidase
MPASACGMFGLKPSRGRNPIGPDFSWEAEGLSIFGVITRTVRDSAAMLDATEGPEPGSPYVAPGPTGFVAALNEGPRQLRVGISTAPDVFGVSMDSACVDAVRIAGVLLQDLGHHVEEVSLPYDEWEVMRAWAILLATHTSAFVADLEARYGKARVRASLEDIPLLLARIGRAMPAQEVGGSRLVARRIGAKLAAFYDDFDVLVTPTLGRAPIPLEQTGPPAAERRLLRFLVSPAAAGLFRVRSFVERVLEAQIEAAARQVLFRTMVANLTGVPAMSVPLHRTENDLPVGVQFLGRYGDEVTLLRLAAQLEQARPWRVAAGT